MSKYYYNDLGPDKNGNGGPDSNAAGWVEVEADTYTEAVGKLPEAKAKYVQALVNKDMTEDPRAWLDEKQHYQDEGIDWDPVGVFIAKTAGWGLGFTLMDETEFRNLQANDEAEAEFNPEAAAQDRAKELFHTLWGKAKSEFPSVEDYNKAEWMELQTLLHDLGIKL